MIGKTKVLYLAQGVFDKGGISRYCRFQIDAIKKKHGENSVVILSLMGPDERGFEDGIDVYWSGIPSPTIWTRIAFVFWSIIAAVKYKPIVIISSIVNFAFITMLLSKLIGVKWINNIYGLEMWTRMTRMKKFALRSANLVISDCFNTAKYVVDHKLVNVTPVVIHDCANTNTYTPGEAKSLNLQKYGIVDRGRFRILFLGRISSNARYKGSERLIRLMQTLGEDYECLIAGQGNDIDYLTRLSVQLGVKDRVHFSGGIAEIDMPDIYRCADAFFLVSEIGEDKGEGIPLTPIEAMSCGIPVIVGNQDGSKELLDSSGCGGICVSPNDINSQITYLEQLKNDICFKVSEQKASRERVLEMFSYDHFALKTNSALKDITYE